MEAVDVAPIRPADVAPAERLIDAVIAGRRQARLGELHDVLACPGFLAWHGDEPIGFATYRLDGDRAELAAIGVAGGRRQGGIGHLLLEAVVDAVRREGARELWLVTSNDNLDALRFYQRRGFRLGELRAGSLDELRASLKPGIPEVGEYGIPMHDELVLVRSL